MKRTVSRFFPSYPAALVYMLQSTEYQTAPYLSWYRRVKDFRQLAKRRSLDKTKAARLLLIALVTGMLLQVLTGLVLAWFGYRNEDISLSLWGALIIVTYPWVWAYGVTFPLLIGRKLIIEPKLQRMISESEKIFASHPGVTIAVAGSYGKTTVKELLRTVISEGKRVAATPANKNVASSHAQFAGKLDGQEDVLIIEYGEGAPGDVASFAGTTHPDLGIITGVAPAHLDQYGTTEAAAKDIFSLGDYLKESDVYVNIESEYASPYLKPGFVSYSRDRVGDWKIDNISISPQGTSFTMKHGKQSLDIKSQLIGRHQVGPLAAVAAIAHTLGLTKKQIEAGMAKTAPFEHRMEPRQLPGDIWIIDDTYNGNIEGMKAGLGMLKELPAKRKIYVTPGLVDQGNEVESVHIKLGEYIADAEPDITVLMNNSTTEAIRRGLDAGGYKGRVMLEDDPLAFYANIEHFVAGGDLVLMQNDWTDNYA